MGVGCLPSGPSARARTLFDDGAGGVETCEGRGGAANEKGKTSHRTARIRCEKKRPRCRIDHCAQVEIENFGE